MCSTVPSRFCREPKIAVKNKLYFINEYGLIRNHISANKLDILNEMNSLKETNFPISLKKK